MLSGTSGLRFDPELPVAQSSTECYRHTPTASILCSVRFKRPSRSGQLWSTHQHRIRSVFLDGVKKPTRIPLSMRLGRLQHSIECRRFRPGNCNSIAVRTSGTVAVLPFPHYPLRSTPPRTKLSIEYRKNGTRAAGTYFMRNEKRLMFFKAIPVPRAIARRGSSAMWNGMPVFSDSLRSNPLMSAPPPAR